MYNLTGGVCSLLHLHICMLHHGYQKYVSSAWGLYGGRRVFNVVKQRWLNLSWHVFVCPLLVIIESHDRVCGGLIQAPKRYAISTGLYQLDPSYKWLHLILLCVPTASLYKSNCLFPKPSWLMSATGSGVRLQYEHWNGVGKWGIPNWLLGLPSAPAELMWCRRLNLHMVRAVSKWQIHVETVSLKVNYKENSEEAMEQTGILHMVTCHSV